MARAKNKRLRLSPITTGRYKKAPIQLSNIPVDDESMDDESIMEIFNEEVNVVKVGKKVTMKIIPSPPPSASKSNKYSPRKQRRKKQRQAADQKKIEKSTGTHIFPRFPC